MALNRASAATRALMGEAAEATAWFGPFRRATPDAGALAPVADRARRVLADIIEDWLAAA